MLTTNDSLRSNRCVSGGVTFFNGQHYAQRVIGDYYIRKKELYAKRGIEKVDLHAS